MRPILTVRLIYPCIDGMIFSLKIPHTETKNLSTDADSRTDTIFKRLRYLFINLLLFFLIELFKKIKIKIKKIKKWGHESGTNQAQVTHKSRTSHARVTHESGTSHA